MRKLPVVEIAGTDFYVDSQLQEFRQVDDPFNTIDFDLCKQTDVKLEIQYDLINRSVFKGTIEEARTRKEDIKTVSLKPLWQLDAIGWMQSRANQQRGENKSMRRGR